MIRELIKSMKQSAHKMKQIGRIALKWTFPALID